MSDGKKAYSEDLDTWLDLCQAAGIPDVKWDVWSAEARYAETGFRERQLTGDRLKKYVARCIEKRDLKIQRQAEREELRLYLRLKKKYEPPAGRKKSAT